MIEITSSLYAYYIVDRASYDVGGMNVTLIDRGNLITKTIIQNWDTIDHDISTCYVTLITDMNSMTSTIVLAV
jgi:hypothetical protein